ncbi:BPSS1780 family membrane protein [Desulfogranum japonicum]|uniref:BPSS1780 family membrane protein n=1 Tax=Desulfogranum japonicum TaxID=231447 RepID=UPI00040A90EF|nr:BPSS1780 family membrane protein [Desulfogranum japonicum]
MEHVEVVLTGRLLDQADMAIAVEKMKAMTGLDESKVQGLLTSGKSTVVKRNITPEIAEKYCQALAKLGIDAKMRPAGEVPTKETQAIEQSVRSKQTVEREQPPAQVSPQKQTRQTHRAPLSQKVKDPANPYATPKAELAREKDNSGSWNTIPGKVSASRGWSWILEAISMFHQEFWLWVRMILVIGIINIPLAFIPVLGQLVLYLISPVLGAGLMIAADKQDQGESPGTWTVFAGFRQQRNQLLMLGLYQILFFVSLGVVSFFIVGGGFLRNILAGVEPQMTDVSITGFIICMVIFFIAMCFFFAAYWFSTCLVGLAGCSAGSSLAASFRATMKNWLPFLVYGICGIIAVFLGGFVISLVIGLIATGLQSSAMGPNIVLIGIMMLLWVLFGLPCTAIVILSVYTSYKDIFYRD